MILECIECGKRAEGSTGYCATHNRLRRKIETVKTPDDPAPIKKVSENQSKLVAQYAKKKKVWLRGKKCQGKFPHNCTIQYDLTCHHMQGRIGYADEWAVENNMPLMLDERFWMPLCLEAHRYIEEHPKFAYEHQYSFKRLTDPIFIKS